MFVDQAIIYVKAGDGGRGIVSFRREKGVPRGGPNGGNGGKGGDVLLRATDAVSTLLDFAYRQHYLARRAEHGRGKDQHGKHSPDLIIPVPVGTIVKDADLDTELVDLVTVNQSVVVARGGRGGRGNAAFATATHQAPREAEPGEAGEARRLRFELKLIAEVGLVGLPNAGKSTLLARISSARPKIADYPFTTLIPHLGVISWAPHRSCVVADIPGLIEGAHDGKGLGHQFLRHVERTTFLLHLVDVSDWALEDPLKALAILRQELAQHSQKLAEIPYAVAATKTDLQDPRARQQTLMRHCEAHGIPAFAISAVTGHGITPLIRYLGQRVQEAARG